LPFAVVSWQSASAILSSAAGTILILAGTVMALLDFGYPAIGYLNAKQDIYIAILALATIVGTLIQLWLLPKISTRFAAVRQAKDNVKKVKTRKGDTGVTAKTVTWRTS
jgi:hypothetical protein